MVSTDRLVYNAVATRKLDRPFYLRHELGPVFDRVELYYVSVRRVLHGCKYA